MNSPGHGTIFNSYSAPAKAPAPAAERVVHSTLFSAYDVASRVAALPPRAPAKNGLAARWDAWRTARRNAREERELLELAKIDVRVMNELNCLLAHRMTP